jgi:hypothetical protein
MLVIIQPPATANASEVSDFMGAISELVRQCRQTGTPVVLTCPDDYLVHVLEGKTTGAYAVHRGGKVELRIEQAAASTPEGEEIDLPEVPDAAAPS